EVVPHAATEVIDSSNAIQAFMDPRIGSIAKRSTT
ncbi:MAG: hypothetical protein JWN44_5418, partial [Myxococcales bacterium]|nr:hypothetical protein [Myxococcales bacterium]